QSHLYVYREIATKFLGRCFQLRGYTRKLFAMTNREYLRPCEEPEWTGNPDISSGDEAISFVCLQGDCHKVFGKMFLITVTINENF
ncbi:MAG TPA: hypothetical protein VF301_05860, partial [Ginsengibacter sp.]